MQADISGRLHAFLTLSLPGRLAINHRGERSVVSVLERGKGANPAFIIVSNDRVNNDNDDNDDDHDDESDENDEEIEEGVHTRARLRHSIAT